MLKQLGLFDAKALKAEVAAPKLAEPIDIGGGFDVQRFVESFPILASAEGGIGRLRELVLDLALRGLLVASDELYSPAARVALFPVPRGWVWRRLADLAQLINGDRSKNYPSAQYRTKSGVPFVNAGHLVSGSVALEDMDFISEERFGLLRSGKIQREDILYCLRGSLGKSAIVREIDRGAIASSLVIIRLLGTDLPDFVYLYLISPLGRAMIAKHDNGTAQPNLSATDVGSFLVPVPPPRRAAPHRRQGR